jgi:hypothetical protein
VSPRFSTALVHHPCVDRHGAIYTTSITNLDVHDLARSSRTYGCDAFYVVTPVTAQREMGERILSYWQDEGVKRNPDRQNALKIAHVVAGVDDAVAMEREASAEKIAPLLVVTSARTDHGRPMATCAELRIALQSERRDALVLFGTGYGLAPVVMQRADIVLAPLTGQAPDGYNHLSVRSAAAILLDRLRG